ncbi:MAG TPA: response regulator transcription factor [Rhizomicrobium sp.]|nr:response regulator transcription factor [Rhizomicrobium sp.]
MRLLLVEDSARLRRGLTLAFRKAGYALDIAADGEEGLWFAENNEYDAIVLDIMLPKLDGISLLRQLRENQSHVHILLLTAKDTVQSRVAGLKAGADDYLVKPFDLDELLARVESLCRRAYGRKDFAISIGDLCIDTAAKKVTRGGRALNLTAHEFTLLEYLARRRDEVVSRADIESHVYGSERDLMSNAVDSAICVLRRKIGNSREAPLIRTRRGLGYVLSAAGKG